MKVVNSTSTVVDLDWDFQSINLNAIILWSLAASAVDDGNTSKVVHSQQSLDNVKGICLYSFIKLGKNNPEDADKTTGFRLQFSLKYIICILKVIWNHLTVGFRKNVTKYNMSWWQEWWIFRSRPSSMTNIMHSIQIPRKFS